MPNTEQSIEISAPAADIWMKLNNFHDLSWATNVVTSNENSGDVDGNSPGANRILNGVFHETLQEIDNDLYTLNYSIDDGPSPVSKEEVANYIGSIKLSPMANGGTLVEWNSSWDARVEDAVEFCHTIYVALLDELKNSFN